MAFVGNRLEINGSANVITSSNNSTMVLSSSNLHITASVVRTVASQLVTGTLAVSGSMTLEGGTSLTLVGGATNGAGNIQLGALASSNYDTNLIYLDSTAKTGGFVFGSTAALGAANGPFFGGRGNTYNAIAGQRGNLYLGAGGPSTPGSGEGQVVILDGGAAVRMRILYGGAIEMSGTTRFSSGLSGSLTKLQDGTSYLIAGTNTSITTGSNGAVTIASTTTGTFNDSNSRLATTASVSFAGAQGAAYFASSSVGVDVFFFVSGTQQQKNTVNGKTSVFGGDVVISGVLHGGQSSFTNNTLLNMNGNNIVLYGGAVQQEATRSDISVFVSGSTGSKGGANKGTTVFGGDVVISGTIYDGSGTTYVAGGGGGSGGGDGAATYLVITATGSLLNERVITAGTNITMSDAGAGGAFTISSFPSGTFNDRSGGLVTTASISIAGARGAAYFASRSVGSSTGADVFFYVSGTARFGHFPAQGFISKRTLFDGDVVTSGTLQMVGAGYTSTIGSDTLFFVSGGTGTKGTALSRGTSVFAGDLHISGNTFLGTVAEAMATTGSALQGTLTFNTAGQSVFYVSGTTGNITANFTNVPVFDGRVVSTNVILSQSSMGGGIVSAVQINSVASTILWANGVTPTANAGKHDVFGFSLIRSGTVWTTLGQMSTYG